jgi:hypothetical protein
MSYTFLVVQGEESSADCFSDIPLSALSKSSHIAERFCSNGSVTESCLGFQSGTMSQHSTGNLGAASQMSCAEGSHARTSAQRAMVPESTESEADFGSRCSEWFAKYDPDSFSWKTLQYSLFGGLTEFSEAWPRWGTMQSGECSEQTALVHAIDESESGYVPTPTKSDYKGGCKTGRDSEFKHWLNRRHGGTYPHPLRVEEMMLWPLGWTDLKPLETGKFQQWCERHGTSCAKEPPQNTMEQAETAYNSRVTQGAKAHIAEAATS